ncbi:MAG: DUF4159 domain-containing protein [Phycisphaerae bacterium]|nr:DUF4159 domain-containing protein [Phycisphaerae bacterium]
MPNRRRDRAMPLAAFVAMLSAALIAWSAGQLFAQGVTGDDVRAAVDKGTKYLRTTQKDDGSWGTYGHYRGGRTALALLALRNVGVAANDPAVARGAEYLRRVPDQWTYVVAVKAQALAAVDPVRYRADISAAADWLAKAQCEETGLWNYTTGQRGGDHSNAQFALLGLHEAARAGAEIPDRVWRRAEKQWSDTQRRDGGWSYRGDVGTSTGSMTAAGVASLYICGNSLTVRQERGYLPGGRANNCGKYGEHRGIARGFDWLTRQFDVTQNPFGSKAYLYYYMYGLERVGILSGARYLGAHDWYREGVVQLIRDQHADGHWHAIDPVADTAFALLYLGKGHRSLLFHKLKWATDNRWRPDRHDIENLIAFIGDKLDEPVSWQVVELDAPLEQWLEAPILYITGHDFPDFKPAEVEKLREFVRQGGSILAEACCSRVEFRTRFNRFAADTFPESALRPLEAAHPIFHAHYDVTWEDVFGIDLGCRTSIIFIARDVSCLWEQADVPELSERAFQLGTNIAAYCTGRQKLRDRLDAVHLVRTNVDAADVPAAALYIGQVMHNGDWRPDPKAMAHLAEFLRDQADVTVVPEARPLQLTDASLRQHPILFMTGHFAFTLTDDELEALRTHLRRGGFLFADACCGRPAFDASFREMLGRLLPEAKLERLGPEHPILSGALGYTLDRVTYRPAVVKEQPDLHTPVLEGITLAGRTVLVYSPYGIGCPIDGHACYGCRSLETADALKLAANIVLYALSY